MPRFGGKKIVSLTKTKFTVSVAAVITNEKKEVLLLDHVLRLGSGWGFAGGFINEGEQIEKALRREVREETGLEIKNLKLLQLRTVKRHIEILFSATATGEPKLNSREIKSLGWFTADNLPKDMNEILKAFIKRLLM